jgi:hypothetical protein
MIVHNKDLTNGREICLLGMVDPSWWVGGHRNGSGKRVAPSRVACLIWYILFGIFWFIVESMNRIFYGLESHHVSKATSIPLLE